jgi:hypothetical protein
MPEGTLWTLIFGVWLEALQEFFHFSGHLSTARGLVGDSVNKRKSVAASDELL